jgi:hypothetical protein
MIGQLNNRADGNLNYKKSDKLQKLYNYFGELTEWGEKGSKIELIFFGLFDFLANYDIDAFHFDLAVRQFMQTKEGEIVLLDPVVSAEVIDILYGKRAG